MYKKGVEKKKMMCSIFKVDKTVQDVTKEILYILDHYDFPDIILHIKGRKYPYLEKIHTLKCDIASIKELIEKWYRRRCHEKWKHEYNAHSQKIIQNLLSITMKNISFCFLIVEERPKEINYNKMLKSYTAKLNKIITNLSSWIDYLCKLETQKKRTLTIYRKINHENTEKNKIYEG
ncbi:MAG: hypothetical protein ACFE9I_16205 [Candidatus Hermodarchaeota archaeon]